MRTALTGINARLLLLPLMAVLALAIIGIISGSTISTVTVAERQARARVVAEVATKLVESYEAKAAKGEMSEQAAQDAAKDGLRAMRYDGTEYVTAHDPAGVTIVNGPFPALEGKLTIDSHDVAGFAREADRLRTEVDSFLVDVRAA